MRSIYPTIIVAVALLYLLVACDSGVDKKDYVSASLDCDPDTIELGETSTVKLGVVTSSQVRSLTVSSWQANGPGSFASTDPMELPAVQEYTFSNVFTPTEIGGVDIEVTYSFLVGEDPDPQGASARCSLDVTGDCAGDGETPTVGEECCPGFAEAGEAGECEAVECADEGETAGAKQCCEGLVQDHENGDVCVLVECDEDRYEVTVEGTGPTDGSGSVTDALTGLTWAHFQFDATSYAAAIDFCEGSDRRLPTKTEAQAITRTALQSECPWGWNGWTTYTSTTGATPGTYWIIQGGGTATEQAPGGDVPVLCVED